MSEEEAAPAPEAARTPPPAPVARYEGVHASDIIIGTFVLLLGAGFLLAGGVCTIMWLPALFHGGADSLSVTMLLVSLASVAFGLFILYHGQRIARGRYRN